MFLFVCGLNITAAHALTVDEFKEACTTLQEEASTADAEGKKVKIRILYYKQQILVNRGIGKSDNKKISNGLHKAGEALTDEELQEMNAFVEQVMEEMAAESEELQKFYGSLKKGTAALSRF